MTCTSTTARASPKQPNQIQAIPSLRDLNDDVGVRDTNAAARLWRSAIMRDSISTCLRGLMRSTGGADNIVVREGKRTHRKSKYKTTHEFHSTTQRQHRQHPLHTRIMHLYEHGHCGIALCGCGKSTQSHPQLTVSRANAKTQSKDNTH